MRRRFAAPAAPLADPRIELAEELARFKQLLARPVAIAALSRSSYRDPAALGLPGKITAEIAAGLASEAVRMELYREWPFAVRLDDAIVQGKVDRLLLYYRGDTVNADSVIAADILDFKTDKIDSAGAADEANAVAERGILPPAIGGLSPRGRRSVST